MVSYVPFDEGMIVPRQVAACIKMLPKGKAPGHDNIYCEHLKYAGASVSSALLHLFTLILLWLSF